MSASQVPHWQTATPTERSLRASDADRDRAAGTLSAHYAAGRLTLEEFQQRLDRAYAAKTDADSGRLAGPRDSGPRVTGWRAPGTVQASAGDRPALQPFWAGLTVGAVVTLLISGVTATPWFAWVALVLVFILLRRWVMGAGRRADERHHRPRP